MGDYARATIRRAPHDNKYFRMHRDTAQDRNLSWEARGMIAYILSQSDTWDIQVHDLEQGCKKGRVYRILDELKDSGYLEDRKKYRDEKGHWQWTPYILHEIPVKNIIEMPDQQTSDEPYPQNADTDDPYPQNRDTEKRDTENAEIKEITNKIEQINKNTLRDSAQAITEVKIDNASKKQFDSVFVTAMIKPKPQKLSSDDYKVFMDTLKTKWGIHGGMVNDVYHQLCGTTKSQKSKRYQYGATFRNKPVTLTELQGFTKWYPTQCQGLPFPTSADSLENWIGKYRTIEKPKSKTIMTVDPNQRGMIYDGASEGVIRFDWTEDKPA